MKQIFTYAMFLLALLLSAGCSEENEPEGPDKPAPSGDGTSTYVPIDWEQTDIQSFNPETGELALAFTDGEIPTFENGYSLLVVETDTSAHIRRVMQSAVSGNTAHLQTIGADMTELFSDTEFTISLTPSAARTETKAGTMASIDANGVLHPVKIVEIGEDGSYRTVYDAAKQTRAEEITPEDVISLFNISKSDVAVGLDTGADLMLSWKSFKQQFQLKADATFRFSDAIHEREINEHLKVKVSELEMCRFMFDANVLSEMILRLDGKGKFSVATSRGDLIMSPPAKMGFFFMTLSGIPVFISLSAELLCDLSLSGEMDFTSTAGLSVEGGLNLGAEYDGAEWKPTHEVRYDYTPHPLEIKADGNLEARVSVYPEIFVKFYELLGPYMAPKLYVRDEFSSGYLEQFASAGNDYYAWTDKVFAGLNMEFGVGLEFFGFRGNVSLINDDYVENQFYNAPDGLTLVSPESGTKVSVGQPVSVRFNVTRKLIGQDLPAIAVPVKFISEGGRVDHDFTITGAQGNADVQWTPETKNATLTAQIFNAEGDVILEETFEPETDGNIIGKWMQQKGYFTVEEPHVPLILDNCLEFREDGTFTFVYNPNGMPCYTDIYDATGTKWIGYFIGSISESAEGTYSYTDSNVSITSCNYYKHNNNGYTYLEDNDWKPYKDIQETDYTGQVQYMLGGDVQFIDENHIRIGMHWYNRLPDNGTKTSVSADTEPSICTYRFEQGKLVPFEVK